MLKVKDYKNLLVFKDITIKEIEKIINKVSRESDYFIKLNGYLINLSWIDKNIYEIKNVNYANSNFNDISDGII